MSLRDLIDAVICAKDGDKEFRLGFLLGWTAEIGNESSGCLLGEASGEFTAEGDTPEDAVRHLLEKVRAGDRSL